MVMGQRLKNFGGLSYGPRFINTESLGAEHSMDSFRASVSHLKFSTNFGAYLSLFEKFTYIVRLPRDPWSK